MHKVIKLDGELCSHCAGKIQDKIEKLDGVNHASVNAITYKFTLDAQDDKFNEVLAQSKKIFNAVEPDCEVLA